MSRWSLLIFRSVGQRSRSKVMLGKGGISVSQTSIFPAGFPYSFSKAPSMHKASVSRDYYMQQRQATGLLVHVIWCPVFIKILTLSLCKKDTYMYLNFKKYITYRKIYDFFIIISMLLKPMSFSCSNPYSNTQMNESWHSCTHYWHWVNKVSVMIYKTL